MERSLTYSNCQSPPNGGRPFTYTRSYSSGKLPPPVHPRRVSAETPASPPDNSSLSRFKQSDSGFMDNALPPLSSMPPLSSTGAECPKHSQERLKYYCQVHDELVCADCLAMEPKHQGHVHTRADDLAESYRSSLQAQLQPLQEMSQDAHSALKNMSARRKEISANGDSVKESIKMTVSQLHLQLQSREQELLDEADRITKQKLKQHDAHQAYLESLASELTQVVDSVTQAASDNSNDIILCHHKQLSEWVLEGTRKFQSMPKEVFVPLQGPNVSFVMDPNILEGCRSIGTVTERQADPQHCFVDEVTARDMTVNQETTLHLMVHDAEGKPYTSHVKGIKVEVTSTTTSIPLDVSIEQDPSRKHQYNIGFVPSESGQYIIKIKIGNAPVRNSPLVVNVGAVVHGTLVGDIKGVLQPYGITVNDNDEVIVVENGKDCVSIFRPDGKQLKTLTGKGKVKFNRPRGITITQSNQLLVSDDDGLKQCNQEGKHMTAIGKTGDGPLEFSFPCGLAVNRDGKVYVCDTFNCRVQILNPDLTFHQYLGTEARQPGSKLNQPYDIAFNSSNRIFVADYGDHSVKMYSPQGDFLGQITMKNDQEPLKNPVSVHVNANDHVFVGEEKMSGLSVYDSLGKYLTTLPVKTSGACGISTDSHNCVYISDRTNRRVQIFK